MAVDINQNREIFLSQVKIFERLGNNMQEALTTFLADAEINILAVTYRIKEVDSFIEKIERKNYKNPIDEIEDILGLRIICYYQTDVDKIREIILNEFEIQESQDKEEILEEDQFGYRSYHLIGKIKKSWLSAPNYRGLENLKFEIQIRTVLMHAWAEIAHKLAYKQKIHIPSHLKRKLFRISAKLEEADEQFEDLKSESNKYKEAIIAELKKTKGQFDYNMKLNLDNLQAFLDFKFPDREKFIENTRSLLDEMILFKISFAMLLEYIDITEEYLDKIEKDSFSSVNIDLKNKKWNQGGVIRTILDLCNEDYYNDRKERLPIAVAEIKQKWIQYIKSKNNK